MKMCLYCTKLAPISKIADNVPRAERVVALTKIVRSEKAPRTGEYASNPERKNTPCFPDLAGGEISFEKGKDIFLWCSALQVFGQVAGLMRTRFCQNYFLGKGFCKTSAHLFLNLEVANGKEIRYEKKSIKSVVDKPH